LNDAEAVMAIYNGQDPGRLIWQPRLEFWYDVNKKRGALPPHLRDASLIDLYDYCHASIRYFSMPLKVKHRNVEVIETWLDEKNLHRAWETPLGKLEETFHYDEWNLSSYNFEYMLKGPEDFKIYEYILMDEEWYWDSAVLEKDQEMVGNRGVLNLFTRRSPVQNLFIERMGFERTVYMMSDYPGVIERHIEAQTAADDAMYQVICMARPPLFNFGENIDANMDPPVYWRRYLLPYYQKRTAQLHAAGVKTSIHIDGAMKPLLRDIQNCPTTSIEACTPLPQGDVTLEEIKYALGETILVDGIPAIYFLPLYPLETLMDCTRQLVETFHPRLITGISDEPPPDSDIERVRLVGEYLASL
jgi:hypothetical protein